MSEAVYQENILALAAREDGGGVLPAPTASVKKSNPLCGDEILLTAQIDDGRIIALAHRTRGCLLCRAAAARFWLWREETKPDSRALLDFAARAQKMFSRGAATAAENRRRDNRRRIANVRAGCRASESPRLRVVAVLGGDGFGGFARICPR